MSSQPSHDYFVELCAVSTSGNLSSEEWQLLREHLSSCPACRETKSQYESIVAVAIPALVPDLSRDAGDSRAAGWSLEKAEASLMARLARQSPIQEIPPPDPQETISWKSYARAAIFLPAFVYLGYQIGLHRRSGTIAVAGQSVSRTADIKSLVSDANSNSTPTPIPNEIEKEDAKIAELRHRLQMSLVEVDRLRERRRGVEDRLSVLQTDLERDSGERRELTQRFSSAQSEVQNLREKLSLEENERTQDSQRLQALEARLVTVTRSSQEKDQEIAKNDELLQHDRDIRNLIGARDLYIAEIYDVAKTGATQKPFGRVFYTKGRSLVFYAYDLDQQPSIRRASTFQAWGRRGIDPQHDVNLGIFYQDEPNKKRWILKSTDPSTLAQIDAVFVTVEPNGESSKPSGKPLLFTYLRLTPNHP